MIERNNEKHDNEGVGEEHRLVANESLSLVNHEPLKTREEMQRDHGWDAALLAIVSASSKKQFAIG